MFIHAVTGIDKNTLELPWQSCFYCEIIDLKTIVKVEYSYISRSATFSFLIEDQRLLFSRVAAFFFLTTATSIIQPSRGWLLDMLQKMLQTLSYFLCKFYFPRENSDVHQGSIHAKSAKRTTISYRLIRTPRCAYQGIGNVSFSENFAYVLNEWSLMCNWGKASRLLKALFKCNVFCSVLSGNIIWRHFCLLVIPGDCVNKLAGIRVPVNTTAFKICNGDNTGIDQHCPNDLLYHFDSATFTVIPYTNGEYYSEYFQTCVNTTTGQPPSKW